MNAVYSRRFMTTIDLADARRRRTNRIAAGVALVFFFAGLTLGFLAR